MSNLTDSQNSDPSSVSDLLDAPSVRGSKGALLDYDPASGSGTCRSCHESAVDVTREQAQLWHAAHQRRCRAARQQLGKVLAFPSARSQR